MTEPPYSRAAALHWAQRATWKFSSYYKYNFTFAARDRALDPLTGQGKIFTAAATVGGDAPDIYRFQVTDPMTWDEICYAGEPGLTITSADGEVIYQG